MLPKFGHPTVDSVIHTFRPSASLAPRNIANGGLFTGITFNQNIYSFDLVCAYYWGKGWVHGVSKV